MPYFAWKGVDLAGNMHTGKLFARSVYDVDQFLFAKREVALLQVQEVSPWWLSGSIPLAHKVHFFRHLATLLHAGILLPEALNILSEQTEHERLQEVLCGLSFDVHEGLPLNVAFQKYPSVFTRLMVQLLDVGHQAGTLGGVLKALGDHAESLADFKKKMRAAALMPVITLLVFCCITLIIFMVVIPQFKTVFASMGKALPPLTAAMVNISEGVQNPLFWGVGGAVVLGVTALSRMPKTVAMQTKIDGLVLRLPCVGALVIHSSLVYFLQALALLLKSGMHVVPALGIAKQAVGNSVLQGYLTQVEQDVNAGYQLSTALQRVPGNIFGQDCQALIHVGENAACMSTMLEKSADLQRAKVDASLKFLTMVFQPLLMVILGLLITFLVFAVYLPVIQLGDIV